MLPAVAALAVGGALVYASHKALIARRRFEGLGRPLHPSVTRSVIVMEHPKPLEQLRDRVARRLRALPEISQVEPVEFRSDPGLEFELQEIRIAVRFSRQHARPTIARLDVAGAEAALWPLPRTLSLAVMELVAGVLPDHERLLIEEAAPT
ncbi:MAG: hypothetical protein GY913_30635 [Proteobacteria bacterium]|nr:hypothetical protein [Pseudomonadota bacterium]MCP4921275.1 hypothetical protein [Pseudomonadota bacterium]